MYKKRKTDGWLFENISSIFSANGGSAGRLQSAQWCMSHVELYHSKLGTQQASFSQKYTLRRDLSCPGIVKLLLNRSSSLLVFSYSSSALCIWIPPPVLWQSCCSGQESSPPECQLTETNSSTSKCICECIREQSASSSSTQQNGAQRDTSSATCFWNREYARACDLHS